MKYKLKYSDAEYISRVELSQKIFFQLEDLLVDFIDYVPFDLDHLEVYSPKLITIMLEIGPEVINSFDLAIFQQKSLRIDFDGDNDYSNAINKLFEKEKRLRSKNKSLSFKNYYNFTEKFGAYKLSQVMIQLKGEEAYIMPFEKSKPEWWDCYNALKHDKYNNLKKATLRNALKGLGALFWLVYDNSKTNFDSNLYVSAVKYLGVDYQSKII